MPSTQTRETAEGRRGDLGRVRELVEAISGDPRHRVHPPRGLPRLGRALPREVVELYECCGGMELHPDTAWSYRISGPHELRSSNEEVLGSAAARELAAAGDRAAHWYVLAESELEVVSVDLHPQRAGYCYDSFWDVHAVPGECAVLALSVAELITRIRDARGRDPFWREQPLHGDAYDC